MRRTALRELETPRMNSAGEMSFGPLKPHLGIVPVLQVLTHSSRVNFGWAVQYTDG